MPVERALFAEDVGTVWTDNPLDSVVAPHVRSQVWTLLRKEDIVTILQHKLQVECCAIFVANAG